MKSKSPATVGDENTQPCVSNCQRMAGSEDFSGCCTRSFVCVWDATAVTVRDAIAKDTARTPTDRRCLIMTPLRGVDGMLGRWVDKKQGRRRRSPEDDRGN